jgi:hypothetical protein
LATLKDSSKTREGITKQAAAILVSIAFFALGGFLFVQAFWYIAGNAGFAEFLGTIGATSGGLAFALLVWGLKR